MKTKLVFLNILTLSLAVIAGPPQENKPMAKDPRPPVTKAPDQQPPMGPETVEAITVTNVVPVVNTVLITNQVIVTNTQLITNRAPAPGFNYEQRLYGGIPPLINPDEAQAIANTFRANYAKLGNPRMMIYVNRELVDEDSGMKLAGRTERTVAQRGHVDQDAQASGGTNQSTSGVQLAGQGEKVVADNSYRFGGRDKLPLADQQTVRDIERELGRQLRYCGSTLADQKLATQLMNDQVLKNFAVPTEGQQAIKDREAVAKYADVVVQVLISSKQIVVSDLTGTRNLPMPDMQITAIRVKDSKILGQASAKDVFNRSPQPANVAASYPTEAIVSVTTLALMKDILYGEGIAIAAGPAQQ